MQETISEENSGFTASRSSCAMFDFSDYAVLTLTGSDHKRFLHNFCTNDIQKLNPHEGCEAFVADIKGRVLGLVQVFVSENSIDLFCQRNTNRKLIDHFEKYLITDDVAIEDKTGSLGQLFFAGPEVEAMLQSAGVLGDPLANHRHRTISHDGMTIDVHRLDLLQQPGYWCCCDKNEQCHLVARLEQSGFVSASKECFEFLRIEAGYPMFDIDMSQENLVQEVGRTGLAVSLEKGCYLGQETIARLDSMGHTNKMLYRLTFDESRSLNRGDRIFSGEEEIGQITSSSSLNGTQPTVAMAYLKQQSNDSYTVASIATDDEKYTESVKSILDVTV